MNRVRCIQFLLIQSFFVFPLYCFLPFNRITILTKPVGCVEDTWYHPAVTRSVIQGLEKIKVSFNVNPRSIEEVGDVVWVLTHDQALLQAIELKKRNIIKCLLAGPNFVVLPHESDRILTLPLIDGVMLPSSAIKQVYIEDEPSLATHTYVCPTGVDTEFWKPSQKNSSCKDVLVYWKTEGEDFCHQVLYALVKNGWNPRVIKYGKYQHEYYRQLLNECVFAIFISKSESQGIALAESWAMNVPTLIWNPYSCEYKGRHLALSSCPFLNPMLGQEWNTIEELDLILKDMARKLPDLRPRAWVLDYMSDEASAYQLLSIINQIMRKKAH